MSWCSLAMSYSITVLRYLTENLDFRAGVRSEEAADSEGNRCAQACKWGHIHTHDSCGCPAQQPKSQSQSCGLS